MSRIFIFISMFFLAACQSDDFETPTYGQKIVVDGWIEQGQPARVFLTLSAPYFSEVDSASLRKLVLTRAKVTVIDGANQEVLTLKANFDYFPPYIYESNSLIGRVGHTYKLMIEYGGVTVTASTYIPEPPELDSIWFEKKVGIDTAGFIMLKFIDKAGEDNFYRVLSRTGRKAKKYTPVQLPNLNGKLIDGQSITLSVAGVKSSALMSGKLQYFNVNDTVNIKFCSEDYPVFNFWVSVQDELLNTQNPFAATNSHVQSNVNGGLGIWAGYGVRYRGIICK